jgi:hypothetical protein
LTIIQGVAKLLEDDRVYDPRMIFECFLVKRGITNKEAIKSLKWKII